MQSYNNLLTIVIPSYNEEKSLNAFLPEILKFCDETGCKLIVVNDGSTDNTLNVLNNFTSDSLTSNSLTSKSLIKIINHKLNKGYGGAIKSGIEAADTKYIITIDADGQHRLNDVENLLALIIQKDADMIVGSRKAIKGNHLRNIGKTIIRLIAKTLMPKQIRFRNHQSKIINHKSNKIHDINSGLKIYNTELAKKYIRLCPDSMAYSDIITLIFISQKHLVFEVPVTVNPRKEGKSTISTMTAIETVREIINIVVLFNPIKVFFPIAILSILAGVAWGIPLILKGRGVSVGVLLAFVTGLVFFFFGLIAEQLSLIRKSNLK